MAIRFLIDENQDIQPGINANSCPKCGSTEITGDQVEINDGTVTQRVSCLDCDTVWTDIYMHSGRDIHNNEVVAL